MLLFKALSSRTRIEMLKLLMNDNYHISGLAKELGISVPVAAKHTRILEEAGLIESKKYGKTQVLNVKRERLYQALDAFSERHEIEVSEGASILEVLKAVAGVKIKKMGDKEFLVSIDGEKGFYIYEVDGKLPDIPINEYKVAGGEEIEIKRLVPVLKKKVKVKVNVNVKNKDKEC